MIESVKTSFFYPIILLLLVPFLSRFISSVIAKATSYNRKIPEYIVCVSGIVAVIVHCTYLAGWLSFPAASGIRLAVLLAAGFAGSTNIGTPSKPIADHAELLIFSVLLMFSALLSLMPAYTAPVILLQCVLAAFVWHFLRVDRLGSE